MATLTAADRRDLGRLTVVLDRFARTVGLPEDVAEARATLDTVQSVRPPDVGTVAADVRRDARDKIAAAVKSGTTPTADAIEAVAEAADAERRARMLAELTAEVVADVTHELTGTIRANGDALVRHAAAQLRASFDVLGEHAGSIPAGYDDGQAFRDDPDRAETWRAVRDAADRIIEAHHARGQLRNLGIIRKPRLDAADHFGLVKNPYAIDSVLLAGVNIHPSHEAAPTGRLPDSPTDRLLEQARRGADFWFPTTSEQDAHAHEVLAELAQPADRRKAEPPAGLRTLQSA